MWLFVGFNFDLGRFLTTAASPEEPDSESDQL